MTGAITQFANAAAGEKSDILGTLGIDIKLLVLQSIAFLLLLWVLTKFVFPTLGAMLDKREKAIADSVKAAHEAEELATKASNETAKLMKQARKDADEIVAGAKAEAVQMVESANKKSRERADRIVAEAEAEISRNVSAAKKALHNETLGLVAEASEKIIGSMVDGKIDKKVVADAVKEVER